MPESKTMNAPIDVHTITLDELRTALATIGVVIPTTARGVRFGVCSAATGTKGLNYAVALGSCSFVVGWVDNDTLEESAAQEIVSNAMA